MLRATRSRLYYQGSTGYLVLVHASRYPRLLRWAMSAVCMNRDACVARDCSILVLANLQATCSTRAFRTVPPQELTDAAHKAARLIDTDAHIQTASRSYTRALWYQSRVWDPDD